VFALHCDHRHGPAEKVYENGPAHQLLKSGLEVKPPHPLAVFDEDGTVLAHYCADLLIDDRLIVALKAVRHVIDEQIAQLLGYLRSSRIETDLLINFGAPILSVKK